VSSSKAGRAKAFYNGCSASVRLSQVSLQPPALRWADA